ncbi:hypothetical protein JOD03_002774 [Chryseomicrobium aureum]|nr:hypothetical protein [Chryseomicrobium aureum]
MQSFLQEGLVLDGWVVLERVGAGKDYVYFFAHKKGHPLTG